ncbi:MAG: ABC transporter ATP-binding protein [Bacteroidota bacterium]
MISVQNLRHAYDGTTVLELDQLDLEQGGRLLIHGLSGSGKTTLLHVLAGLLRPTAGTVQVAGEPIYDMAEHARDQFRGRRIGLVFQRLHLLPTLTVLDNVLAAAYAAGMTQDGARARDLLATVDLADKADAYPEQLSYGQRQRVAIARAVMNKPTVLLADEPTASLDGTRSQDVLDLLLAQASEHNATLIVATHDERIRDAFNTVLEV